MKVVRKIIENQFQGCGVIKFIQGLFVKNSRKTIGKGEIQIGGGDYGIRINSVETFQGISTISRI